MFRLQRPSFSNLVLPLILSTGVVLSVCGALYMREADQVSFTALDNENRRMDRFTGLFHSDIESAVSDLRLVATGDAFQDYLTSGDPAQLARAAHRDIFFSKDDLDYDQIRFLDENGQEMLRVNHDGVVVPQDQLQNKADRPYFQKANALSADQIYLSALELNVENGAIEQPIKPLLRLAMPVFDQTGKRRGVYVINYLAENSINRLRMFVPRYQQRFRLLNPEGYWLAGERPEDEWGFAIPGRADLTMAKKYPELWAKVLHDAVGQEPFQGGYFTWRHAVPSEFVTGKPVTLVSDQEFLIFASQISEDEWNSLFVSLRQTFVVIAFILMILTLGLTWFFQARRQTQLERDRFFSLTRDMLCIAGFDGYFKRVNPAWEAALGFKQEEILGKPFLDFVHPDDREITIAKTADLASGEEVLSFENRYRCKDGTYRWLQWSARPLVGENLIYGSARDMTDRKRTEEEITRLNEEMKERANQLEAANKELESFSYSVSHDLRAPLRHIHGFVELLQKSPVLQGDEPSRRQMGIIAKAAKEMGMLIDDLLAFSRTGRAEMRPGRVNMREMIGQIIADRELEIKGRKVTWDIKPLPVIEGDAGLLRLVWVNLIENALKYTRRCEEAKIEIASQPSTDAARREVVFYVKDNGVGFDMKYASKLFGVFQRLHRAADFEGTGIGLANVQRIIHRHGGHVWAEAKPDAGATFYFSLPLTATQPARTHEHGKNQTNSIGGR